MRRFIVFFCLMSVSLLSFSQEQGLADWVKYTLDGYLCVIENDHNTQTLSETDFKNHLIDNARKNLARQIEVQVKETAALSKEANNGVSSIQYASVTTFHTDVTLKLVETRALYDSATAEGWAIAYIDKQAARRLYTAEVHSGLSRMESALTIADNYVETNFKVKAKKTLQDALDILPALDENLSWLRLFGQDLAESTSNEEQRNRLEQQLRAQLAQITYSNGIYVTCTADLFGQNYPSLQNKVKGLLAAQECTFVDDVSDADWIIKITANTREYNISAYGNFKAYTAYVDAYISITKGTTNQRICEDELSYKETHTLNYTEAARMAYANITENIINLLKKYIQ